MSKQIQQLLQEGQQELENKNIDNAEIDTYLLLGHCLQMRRTEMLISASQEVDDEHCQVFRSLIKRRAAHEPVAYIVSEREFWSLPFWVNENVLIPRPETEFLLETVFQHVAKSGRQISQCLDLCCGSGAIAVVLALELNSVVTALDLSVGALEVTQRNAARHGVDHLIIPVCSDLFSAIGSRQLFPLIVSNPPYVSTSELKNTLQPEVAGFEPHLALNGGPEGLDCIQRIAADILHYLEPDGLFFMEFGADQAKQIDKIFRMVRLQDRFFEVLNIYPDYSGRDRILAAKMNNYQ